MTSLRQTVYAYLVVFFIVFMTMFLVGCGDDANDNPSDPDVIKIQQCVNSGGHALYSTDDSGFVYFIACDRN